MASCTITPIAANSKACSGKCKSSDCSSSASRVWVVAACEGMITLFEKDLEGKLSAVTQCPKSVFAALDQFQQFIQDADQAKAFDQLILVGGSSDIAWVHAALPVASTPNIIAEIKYPLLAVWFRQPLPMRDLVQAIQHLFAS